MMYDSLIKLLEEAVKELEDEHNEAIAVRDSVERIDLAINYINLVITKMSRLNRS